MPAFTLHGDQPRLIAEWLLSLTRGADTAVTGDSSRGRALFFGNAGCAACHSIGGSGKGFAPDLSNTGAQRSVADLARQIAHPGENPRGGNGVEVTTANGERIRGLIVAETTFSLFVRDKDEKLHLLPKSAIRQRENLKTLMPKLDLASARVDDLVAFLKHAEVPEPDLSVWNPAADFNVTFERLRNSAAEPQNWLS
jgi:putative heme-binding domain-containing protein